MTDDNPTGVLAPDELGPNDEHVRELEDGRRIVHADGGTSSTQDDTTGQRQSGKPEGGHGGQSAAETAPGSHANLGDLAGAHALAAGARADDAEDTIVADTDDVSEAFETLVCWYAGLVAEERQPETVLAVLFEHTDLDLEVRPQ